MIECLEGSETASGSGLTRSIQFLGKAADNSSIGQNGDESSSIWFGSAASVPSEEHAVCTDYILFTAIKAQHGLLKALW
jgi:hypothetical protein